MQKTDDNVSIKLQTGVYGQFRNLNNKVWYALGEFVDNAVQSFEDNKSKLTEIHGDDFTLEVRININKDEDIITIKDNAAGINSNNYRRAFEPANIPVDNSGLHEYGMGMKTAAIWLSDLWSVKTKAIEEIEERFVEFDLKRVIEEDREILDVIKTNKKYIDHYTELKLTKLSHNAPSGHQLDKIKRHLASIYRNFIRSNSLHLYINEEKLTYKNPEILVAPYYKNLDGENIFWKKSINFSMGKYSAKGFIGVLKTMSSNNLNGISLFRRGRVIIGSGNEKYRPKELCGQIGSPRYKRIFGELELEGFGVSFNKGSFIEVEELDALIKAIKIEISGNKLDLYQQAQKYIKPKTKGHNEKVARNLVKILKKANTYEEKKKKPSLVVPTNHDVAQQEEKLKNVEVIDSYKDKETIRGVDYELIQEFITDESIPSLYTFEVDYSSSGEVKVVYKINLANSFFSLLGKFNNETDYKPIVAIIKSLVLAELASVNQGTINGGNIRLNFNKFLNDAL